MSRRKLAFLADDLTGSMDTGVQLLKAGYEVGIPLKEGANAPEQQVDVTVVNTNTRNCALEEAEEPVSIALEGLRRSNRELIYKKIDSTFRGPIGAELRVIASRTSRPIVIVPAIPSSGRITAGGYHLVNGVPISETIYAEEPARSRGDSFLPSILESQCGLKCGLIPLKTVAGGERAIAEALDALISEGTTITVGDATTEAHLRAFASAIRGHSSGALACGSAGLMTHLFPTFGPTPPRGVQPSKDPILLLAGTTNTVAQAQVKLAVAKGLFEQIVVDVPRLVGGMAEREREIAEVTEAAKRALRNGGDVAVSSGKEIRFPEGQTRAKRATISEAFGDVVRSILREFSPAALVATGGDIALACCRALEATFLQIAGEPVPLVVAGKLLGGVRPDLPIVTKAGGFGSEDAFVRLHDLIHAKEE